MPQNQTVTLFIQCLIDGLYPEVGEAMVRLFGKLDISVIYPSDQTCCGQPAFNSGYRKQAKIAARRFVNVFEAAQVIVCPSGSCVNMVRNHYPQLFRDDPLWLPRVQQIGAKTFELTEYLVDRLGITDLKTRFKGRITYHDSCHLLRGLGVREQPRKLLHNMSNVEFVEMHNSDYCCGFGGAFAFKYPEISTAMLDDKIENIKNSGAEVVVGCDMGCLMNIQGRLSRQGLGIRVMHIVQLLAD